MSVNLESDAVVQLAEDFVAKYRRGEKPDLQEYVKQFPELADEVASLIEALLFIEKLGNNGSSSRHRLRPDHLSEYGEYRILGEIGRGGMGVVYEAVQASLNRPVALKVLPKASTANTVMKQRFLREARTAAALHHSHIVPVHGVGEQDGACYFVMQKIDGIALDRIIHHLKNATKTAPSTAHGRMNDSTLPPDSLPKKPDSASSHPRPMTVQQLAHHWETMPLSTRCREAARIGAAIADALSYAHEQGVLHRDVKPGNILIDHQQHPWLNDFGLAQVNDANDLTATGQVVGTLRYLPPERLKGVSSEAGDVYSLGVTLYELITLQNPFPGADHAQLVRQIPSVDPPSLQRLNSSIPTDLNTIVMKCLEKEPEKRYASAAALAADLKRFLNDEAIAARSPSMIYRISKLARRHRGAVVAASLILLTLIAGIIGTSMGMFSARKALEDVKLERDQKIAAFVMLEKEQDATQKALELEKATRRQAIIALRQQSDAMVSYQLQRRSTLSDEDRAYLQKLIALYQNFATLRGEDEESKALQAEGYYRIGDIQRALGDTTAAIAALEQASQIYLELLKLFPLRQYRLQLATTCGMKGHAFLEAGQSEEAVDAFQQGMAVLAVLPEKEQTLREVLEQRFELLQGKGNALVKLQGYEKALAEYQQAAELNSTYRQSFPNEVAGLNHEASIQANLALAYGGLQKVRESQLAYQKALSLRGDLVSKFPRNPDYQISLSTMQGNYASFLRDQKQYPQALAVYHEALAIRKLLASSFPAALGFQTDVANTHEFIASIHNLLREWEDAHKHHQEAIKLRQPLAKNFPQLTGNIISLGGTYCNRGNMQRQLQRYDAALESYRLAIETLEIGMQKVKQQDRARQFLHNSYSGRARTYLDKKDYEKSLADWNKAIEYNPETIAPHYRRLLCLAYVHPDQVSAAIQQLPAKERDTNPSRYEVATSLAVASGQSRDAQQQEQLAKASLELLRQMADNGYLKDPRRLERFQNNSLFKPLHHRTDFKQWLASLTKP